MGELLLRFPPLFVFRALIRSRATGSRARSSGVPRILELHFFRFCGICNRNGKHCREIHVEGGGGKRINFEITENTRTGRERLKTQWPTYYRCMKERRLNGTRLFIHNRLLIAFPRRGSLKKRTERGEKKHASKRRVTLPDHIDVAFVVFVRIKDSFLYVSRNLHSWRPVTLIVRTLSARTKAKQRERDGTVRSTHVKRPRVVIEETGKSSTNHCLRTNGDNVSATGVTRLLKPTTVSMALLNPLTWTTESHALRLVIRIVTRIKLPY